ncbi:acyltransferase family protein [Enteractinococcus helveticum]|uniref:Uncharacterized protein n=1 Tax=Enteractinococcus helveticum TaxID=1837282 RepID=A0A1B7LVE3_9MICC|nr:acyltransferase family protein [Enteractinococcus helveticum]OAV52199.1 hypothetical protein A6F49_01080 [Enteractinococcus helveticum]
MAILIGVVFVASFVYAIYVGSFNQDENYLMTTTRAWQLAFGGLLALAGGTIRLPQPLRVPAGWLGLGMVVTTGFIFDGAQLFPGPWALYPLAGLTLVLISAGPLGGHHDPEQTATRFLSNKPLAWIGDHAYGLYLWHWPILIYYLELRDRDAISWRGALVILAVTVVLAMLTFRYIEQPLKRRQTQRTGVDARRINKVVVAAAAGSIIVAGTGATLVLQQPHNQTANVFDDWDWETHPGAMATTNQYTTPEGINYLPAVEELTAQQATIYDQSCVQKLGNDPGLDEVTVCEDPNKPDDPTATVVISGGSHSVHWHAALEALAAEYNWELLVVNKDACVFMNSDNPDTASCNSWNDNYIDWLENHDVDLVIANGTRVFSESPERIHEGAQHRWEQITNTSAELLLVRGTPRPGERVDDCLADGGSPEDCGATTEQLAEINPLEHEDLPAGAHHIDLLEHVCPEGATTGLDQCPAVVGNVVVWYDGSHLTNQYVATMTALIEAELRETVSWLFD